MFIFAAMFILSQASADTLYGNMQTVSQDMLDRAGGDANNFLHTNEFILAISKHYQRSILFQVLHLLFLFSL